MRKYLIMAFVVVSGLINAPTALADGGYSVLDGSSSSSVTDFLKSKTDRLAGFDSNFLRHKASAKYANEDAIRTQELPGLAVVVGGGSKDNPVHIWPPHIRATGDLENGPHEASAPKTMTATAQFDWFAAVVLPCVGILFLMSHLSILVTKIWSRLSHAR